MNEAVHKFANLQFINLLKNQNPKVVKLINSMGGRGSPCHNSDVFVVQIISSIGRCS